MPQILHACEERGEAFITCREVLTHLKEKIPERMDIKSAIMMVKETGNSLAKISSEDFLKMKEMDSEQQITLKFYTLLVSNLTSDRVRCLLLHFLIYLPSCFF